MKLGVDVAGIERMARLLDRFPNAERRMFTDAERAHCRSFADPARHFAGTFAAKEAVVKAAGLGSIHAWVRRIEITRSPEGSPAVTVAGHELGDDVTLSISHDSGVAIAVALLG